MKIEASNKRLKELQALPLERKVGFTIARITEWNIYYKENSCILFSPDKVSIVLLYISRKLYPEMSCVYFDLGIDDPKIIDYVRNNNIEIIKSETDFKEDSYDLVWKERKRLYKIYQKETGKYPILGTKTEDSKYLKSLWLKNGCNMFDGKDQKCRPMSF